MLDGLQHRMQSAEAQTSDDVARVEKYQLVYCICHLKLKVL